MRFICFLGKYALVWFGLFVEFDYAASLCFSIKIDTRVVFVDGE